MPRKARIVIPHVAHHIVQRGNNRQNILIEEEDFSNYCYWINEYARTYEVKVLAYCLMNNHVHLVVVPEDQTGLSRLFNTAHMRYARYMNYKRKTSGHLWQGRFYSCVLDDAHLYRAIRYVEQNPVRAKMVQRPWDYPWSSARWHIGKSVKRYIKVKDTEVIDSRHWREYLLDHDSKMDERMRRATNKGKAVANEEFIDYWENMLRCVLRELKPGPHPKSQDKG